LQTPLCDHPVRMSMLAATCGPVQCVDTSPLHPGGPVDDRMQLVYTAVFWASVALGVLVTALLLYSMLRFRRRNDEDEPRQFHGNTRLEIGWTLLPFVVFLGLFVLTAANMPFVNDIPQSAPMNVTVIGQQFSWTFDYGTSTSGKRVQSFGTLYVPQDTQVGLQIVSTDPPCKAPASAPSVQGFAQALAQQGCGVNHSFYVPSLAGQMNAIPGQVNTMWLEARAGTYYGQCTELCGTGHAQMTLTVISLPNNQFQSCVFGSPSGSIDPNSTACKVGGS
jgi:cytochrome c oxidase subunit 2